MHITTGVRAKSNLHRLFVIRDAIACVMIIDPAIIDVDLQVRINAAIEGIEARERVRVLYAVESGSRAWGFASADSDYDVRFIYVREPQAYLGLHRRRDVIEVPIDSVLDVSGWDLPKALHLFRKSNPPLMEWLGSPVVYRDDGALAPTLRALSTSFFSPRACMHHYVSMATSNQKQYLQGPTVRLKKYLYVLRPLLAGRWILDGKGMPPTTFQDLLDASLPSGPVRAVVDEVIERKKHSRELDDAEPLPVLGDYLVAGIAELRALADAAADVAGDEAVLDALFRETLWRLWPEVGSWR